MNSGVKKKTSRRPRVRHCKGRAKHGGRCRTRVAGFSTHCRNHKHQLDQQRDLLPGHTSPNSKNGLESKCPGAIVHNIPWEEETGKAGADATPMEISCDDDGDAPVLCGSKGIHESADAPYERSSGMADDGTSRGLGEGSRVNGNAGLGRGPEGTNDAQTPDPSGDMDAGGQDTTADGVRPSGVTVNKDSWNTKHENCGNTTNKNCGNNATINRTSQAIRLQGVYQTFITNNYSSFFSPDDPVIKELVLKAAAEMVHITQKYDVAPSRGRDMVELALFDLVVVCDNSGSMWRYRNAMKDTLRHLVTISSLLLPKGITIQFLNANNDGRDVYHDITDGSQVDKIFQTVELLKVKNLWGSSGLGEVVNKKVLHPMIIRKAQAKELKRPVITIMISDAKPSSRKDGEMVKSTIRSCKESPELNDYGERAALFLLSRVGNSKAGEKFLNELQGDDSINDILHCSVESLDKWQAEFQKPGSENKYTGKLIELFLTALDRRAAH
ncbi:hypothetical protein BO71DRAFT_345548 [Aspergillus ellipticus CBS 707.79]|uniref:VWFA domain-containing protein n=1 Tax=Aspergillus ellipticus CBS 707.79 TaxID=1448320 RepID=A0A319EBU0_9EURO|nr:hypothetical protein BO71DRAFT_345548 [Aspergillus ellipticus CBS 707.79]